MARAGLKIDIVASFRAVDTPEYKAAAESGEFRNEKVVFVEKWLRENVDPSLTVTSVTGFNTDGSFYTTVDNSPKSGYYRVKLDYPAKKLEIEDIVLKSTILDTELEKLYKLYEKDSVTAFEFDEKNMLITLETGYYEGAAPFTASYAMNVSLSDEGISWKASRPHHPADLAGECTKYLEWVLGANTKFYFTGDNEFSNIEAYTQKGIKYELAVYTEMENLSGYFVISVDPRNDRFTLVTFISLSQIVNDIGIKYGFDKDGYIVKAISLDESRSVLSLSLESKSDTQVPSATASVSYSIRFNPEHKTLEYIQM
jgi:hypothetical protein